MIVGLLQFELLIHDAVSIKDKRNVVNSVKDKLHREHLVSVAEIGLLDHMSAARLGLAMVASDGKYVGQTLDRITAKLRTIPGAELGDCFREILHDPEVSGTGDSHADAAPPSPRDADHSLDAEMLRRASELDAT
jgi:uncharacterized protein